MISFWQFFIFIEKKGVISKQNNKLQCNKAKKNYLVSFSAHKSGCAYCRWRKPKQDHQRSELTK